MKVATFKLLINYLFVLLIIAGFSACSDDCIYKLYDNNSVGELCGRFCPKEDESGNVQTDSDGQVVFDDVPQANVDRYNCELPDSN